ncbi:MAG: hypothetical protein PVF68_03825 [Acidobacteriota bacterium]|jgi:hypothetical protein
MFSTNEQIARQVYRSLKTPSDNDRTTDPILAFHFRGRDDYIMMRCNKEPEVSIKGAGQDPGEVKFFAYSDFKDFREDDVIFRLKDEISLIELYARGAIEPQSFKNWNDFQKWLGTLEENGVQISLKLPCLVYRAVKNQKPSMQNFIVESIKLALKQPGAGKKAGHARKKAG